MESCDGDKSNHSKTLMQMIQTFIDHQNLSSVSSSPLDVDTHSVKEWVHNLLPVSETRVPFPTLRDHAVQRGYGHARTDSTESTQSSSLFSWYSDVDDAWDADEHEHENEDIRREKPSLVAPPIVERVLESERVLGKETMRQRGALVRKKRVEQVTKDQVRDDTIWQQATPPPLTDLPSPPMVSRISIVDDFMPGFVPDYSPMKPRRSIPISKAISLPHLRGENGEQTHSVTEENANAKTKSNVPHPRVLNHQQLRVETQNLIPPPAPHSRTYNRQQRPSQTPELTFFPAPQTHTQNQNQNQNHYSCPPQSFSSSTGIQSTSHTRIASHEEPERGRKYISNSNKRNTTAPRRPNLSPSRHIGAQLSYQYPPPGSSYSSHSRRSPIAPPPPPPAHGPQVRTIDGYVAAPRRGVKSAWDLREKFHTTVHKTPEQSESSPFAVSDKRSVLADLLRSEGKRQPNSTPNNVMEQRTRDGKLRKYRGAEQWRETDTGGFF